MADPFNPVADLTGSKIGEYDIISRLGVGGMGIVYEGRQPVIGKRVAVKVLLPQLSADKELVDRFVSEARAVNEIGHRGIVDIFSFGQLPTGQHYFVMEYLNGLPFDRLIKTRAPIPPAEALWWTEEICEALQGAHEAGIIHRDIKPSNLFLVDTGRGRPYVKLLDFGIAKLGAKQGEASPQTRASMVVGTPDYMSPEQARGKAITPATDVYALGCVLFELLTAKRTFKGENALETMFMHVENAPPKVSDVLQGLPAPLDDLLLWTMEKDPAARPASAEEFRAHLAEIRATLPPIEIAPRPSPSRENPMGLSPSGRQLPVSATPRPPTSSGPRRTLSGSDNPAVPGRAASGNHPATPARRTATSGNHPATPVRIPSGTMMVPPPVPIPVDLSFTGENPKVQAQTKVLPPIRPELEAMTRELRPIGLPPEPVTEVPPDPVAEAPRPELPPEPVTEVPPDPVAEAPRPELPRERVTEVPQDPVAVVAAAPKPAVEEDDDFDEFGFPKKRRLPLVWIIAAVALIGGAIAFFQTRETPKPAQPVAEAKPAEPTTITPEALTARIAAINKKLSLSAKSDHALRPVLAQAKADAAKADTEVKRRAVWTFIDEKLGQFEAR